MKRECGGKDGNGRRGVVETNRVGFCVLVYPHSSQREWECCVKECVDVCICPAATSGSYFFYWLCGVAVRGPGAATGTAGAASVCYCIRGYKGTTDCPGVKCMLGTIRTAAQRPPGPLLFITLFISYSLFTGRLCSQAV